METCGGVRGYDSLHNSCWRKLWDNISEEDGVKLEGCATTELWENSSVLMAENKQYSLGKQINHSVGEALWFLVPPASSPIVSCR